jgi:hypothetical protein
MARRSRFYFRLLRSGGNSCRRSDRLPSSSDSVDLLGRPDGDEMTRDDDNFEAVTRVNLPKVPVPSPSSGRRNSRRRVSGSRRSLNVRAHRAPIWIIATVVALGVALVILVV